MFWRILDAISLIKVVVEGTKGLVSSIISYLKKKKSERDQKKIDKAVNDLAQARREGESIQQMLERKRRAACEIEKMVNPESQCDIDSPADLTSFADPPHHGPSKLPNDP